jgi:hypothetical protein
VLVASQIKVRGQFKGSGLTVIFNVFDCGIIMMIVADVVVV